MKPTVYCFLMVLFCWSCIKKEVITPQSELKLNDETKNCGEFVVYKFGTYNGKEITFEVRSYAEKLDTSSNKTVNITLTKGDCCDPKIAITTYKNYPLFSFCPGIIPKDFQPEPDQTWTSESGTLSMKVIEKLPSPPIAFPMFKVNFELKNIQLKNEKGETITIPSVIMNNVIIGGPIPG